MGNLQITKLWADSVEPFCEIQLKAEGNEVTTCHTFYTSDTELTGLSKSVMQFSKGESKECIWKAGQDCCIRLFYLDNAMHIRGEITICVDDIDSHVCTFYIDGLEAGPLECFAKVLPGLSVGDTVSVF